MAESLDHERIRSSVLEKVVIVAIMVLLAAMTAVVMNRLENAKLLDRARADCKVWASAVGSYRWKYGDYPLGLATLTEAHSDGAPPFMFAKSLYDPWGHEYDYSPPSGNSRRRLEIWSSGPRMDDPNGVVSNWESGPLYPFQAGD
jgi:hypothetical protein